jgi:hypothetical protein
MFAPLDKLLRNRREALTYEPSPGEVSLLKQLRSSSEWKAFLKMLDRRVMLESQALLAQDTENVDFLRGRLSGLRAAPALVDQALAREEQEDGRERAKRESDERQQRRRRAVTFASPAWGAERAKSGSSE